MSLVLDIANWTTVMTPLDLYSRLHTHRGTVVTDMAFGEGGGDLAVVAFPTSRIHIPLHGLSV